MPREINPWAMYPRKTSTAYLPEALKREVTTKANELIETVLKPKYIQPAPENPRSIILSISTASGTTRRSIQV